MDESLLIWGLLFSMVGLGFFIYGRKQKVMAPLACGLVLMVIPYFMPNTIALFIVGAVLIAVPYFLRN